MPSLERSSLAVALDAWRSLLGAPHAVDSGAELDAAATATFATAHRPLAILRPRTREEVQDVVRIANRHGVPLYVVSSGKNWGFGSRVPPAAGCVLVELARLDRIVEFDEELGYLTVEPGVTFGAAYAFLKERQSRLFLSSTGASPAASLIGNALERGDGSGPYGDRFAHVCGLEVVLPTGECVHTGFGRFEGARTAPLHRWGVGPAADGLFSQSGLGVVTRATFWLAPLPRSLHIVRFEVNTHEKLGALVNALRVLRMDGTIRSAVGLWNDYRVISTAQQYPWELTGGTTPLSAAHLGTLNEGKSSAVWHGVAALHAPSVGQGRADRAHVVARLAQVTDALSVSEYSGDPVSGQELAGDGDPAALFHQGIPHEQSLRSVYWRKRDAAPAAPDPDRDRCGVIWVCPVLPFRGADVIAATELARATMIEHGLDPLLAMIGQTERTIYLVPLLIYDRDVPGDDERAMACHDALLGQLCERGYLPHRLGTQAMQSLPPANDDYPVLLERLKRALDPNDVLAPGRYDFRHEWRGTKGHGEG
jgi:4-cresol dehydrogenase (hydroxylating)